LGQPLTNARLIAFLLCCGASAAGASPTTTPQIVAAANAFVATLTDAQKGALFFESGDTAQKQRWSNLPAGIFKRTGLMWGSLKEPQRAAWLAVMQATLSAEGYRRVVDEWRADDALARESGAGRGPQFGMGFYWIALIGKPSETERWQWQWGGHHVTINATVVGPHVSLTPSFIGVQPATFTDASGAVVRPLGDIEHDALALMNWLDADQQRTASLPRRPADVVLGPGEDGKTIAPEGLAAARMSDDQRAGLMRLIGHYSGLVNDEDAAERAAEIRAGLDRTYFAWNGPTTPGAAVYFRVTGPALVIEYSTQAQGPGSGGGTQSPSHIHGIYRDPTNDYAARFVR
jgi:uncharacterized protein DUF3500